MSYKSLHQKETMKQQRMELKKRMEAEASLKASIAVTQEALHMRRAKEKARLQKQREEEDRQREALEAAGANSIRVMHQQKLQEDLHTKEKELRERQKARRAEIASKLLLEEERKEKREKQQARLLHPVLPPVKQSRVLKQQDTLQSPSLQGQEESSRVDISYISGSLKEGSQKEGAGSMEKGGRESECLVQPEFTGLWDCKHMDHMSVPDEDIPLRTPLRSMMAGLSKILADRKAVGGKEIKGPSFVSKPEIIYFKDFNVRKTYKKKVVLTNVSHAINYCRLLEVSQDLMDFISVKFEPSGPLSTGMSCELEAVFTPLLNENLDGEIRFQSATGPFSVTIKCIRKKCEMVVDNSLIDFGTHVVGQTIVRVITLTNRGALGTRFTLAPLSTSSLQSLSQHSSPIIQVPDDNFENAAPLNDAPEDIPSAEESSENITHDKENSDISSASGDTSTAVEVTVADQGSEEAGLEESEVTEVKEDLDSKITEISIGKVREGEVGPFASVKLPIVFTPTIPGETSLDVQITFSQPECEAIVVSARGVSESIPVWVTKLSMDLKICMYDCLYQDTIEVHSRANTALKVTFDVCKELKNHLNILPKSGYVQSKSSFNAQLKFLPRSSLPLDAKTFFNQDIGVLEVPLTIQVADQPKSVLFMVHAVVTTSDLEFDHAEVDFGYCSIFESVRTSVKLTNRSLLPQDFGFVSIPKFIDVQPNDGLGTLLPLQTMEIDLIFSATSAGEFNFQLTCKSGINRDFLLSCRAIGVRPLLELSESLVQFGETAVGDCSTALLYVINSHTSRNEFTHPVPRIGKGPAAPVGPRFFAFGPPENSEVVLTPATGRVLPGQRCLVQVTFCPSLTDDMIREEALQLVWRREELRMQELQKAEYEAACRRETEPEAPTSKEDPKKSKKRNLTEQDSSKTSMKEKSSKVSMTSKIDNPFQPLSPEDIQIGLDDYVAGKVSLIRSFKERSNRYVIPCFVSDKDVLQQKSKELAYSHCNTLYLELYCPAIKPTLVVISDNGCTSLNFSQVVIGQKILKKVTIQNISSEIVKLKSSVLDLYGPFSVVNALRDVRPGDTHTLLLAFKPALSKKYRETLQVSCSKMTLEFVLHGEGVDPLVTCLHEGLVMNFGYVRQRESVTQSFKLQNSSSVLVRFRVLLDSLCSTQHNNARLLPAFLSSYYTSCSTLGTQNYSGHSVFRVSPTEGSIAPGKSHDITVTFQPDHESRHFRDVLSVELLNKKTVCILELRGAAYRNTMFICGGEPLDICSESLIPPDIFSTGEEEHTGLTEDDKPPTPLLLTLTSVVDQDKVTTAIQKLEVGCIQSSQPVAKKGVEFVWENVSDLLQLGFTVDPIKASVEAGHSRTITITWMPPAGHTPNKVIQVCVPLILRGEVTEEYNVTLLAFVSNNTQPDFSVQ